MIIANIWKNSYNNFDICIWSKTDRKKGLKTTFSCFWAPKRRNFTPPPQTLGDGYQTRKLYFCFRFCSRHQIRGFPVFFYQINLAYFKNCNSTYFYIHIIVLKQGQNRPYLLDPLELKFIYYCIFYILNLIQ